MAETKCEIRLGDCTELLREYPNGFFDLIVTSPPYADSRARTYGGIKPSQYVDWFLLRAKEFLRVLKPSGTFILNIKEKVVAGERHTYVIELILEMRTQGWLWTEEFIWHKKNCHPGKWPNRFRDAWERCLQFNKVSRDLSAGAFTGATNRPRKGLTSSLRKRALPTSSQSSQGQIGGMPVKSDE